jgi:hypothetical protein
MTGFKLGKLPARPNAVSLKLSTDLPTLPAVPKAFGHQDLETGPWGMLGNDAYGDCVWAGAAHETILWNLERKFPVTFTDTSVLSDYSKVTGFNPKNPSTDQGTDMQVAAKFRQKTGVRDSIGARHKIMAYVALEGLDEIAAAAYLFGAAGIGIQFPASAMTQFNNGNPWSVVKGSSIEGGHYVPIIGRLANGHYLVVTWGKVQEVLPSFLTKYVDEAIAYVSAETLTAGKSPEGFDVAALMADLKALS